MATQTSSSGRRAGAFDIRLIIALLIGVYGLVITVLGLGFTTEQELAKADGFNINLWSGIGMLIVAGLFVLWARLRPIVLPEQAEEGADETTDEAG